MKAQGYTVGFVPTMGFLHEGHISLIRNAHKENDKVVVSIFVNPTQFGAGEDFETYPRNPEKDFILCQDAGADLIFYPSKEEIYPPSFDTFVDIDGPSKRLCGSSRPGHFKGVCTIVAKLFNIVSPDNAYFGKKDAQQLAVIEKMVKDLNFDIKIIGCPIIREKDGLALSSRNSYLNKEERLIAPALFRALNHGRELILNGEKESEQIIEKIKQHLNHESQIQIDYIDIVRFPEIEPVAFIEGNILVAAAIYIGKTRLIDNFILSEEA